MKYNYLRYLFIGKSNLNDKTQSVSAMLPVLRTHADSRIRPMPYVIKLNHNMAHLPEYLPELTMKEHVAKIAAASLLASTTFVVCARFVVGSAGKSHSSWSWRS